MKSRVLLLELLVILMVPCTSASTCFSGPESVFVRLKILIFDFGLFLYDIGSDIYNGITFIDEGNPVWGSIILGVIFLPMTVFFVGHVISEYYHEDSSLCIKLLIFLLCAPILAVPAIPIMTVMYIVYLANVFAGKCVQPGYIDDKLGKNLAEMLKLLEAVAEANLQAVLVTYVTLVTGLSGSTFSQFMQIGGPLASLISVAKTCCEKHLRDIDDDRKDPNLTTTMKALLFFAPHVLWRTTATAFVAAFLKFYSLIPLAIHLLFCSGITNFLHGFHATHSDEGYFLSFALSLFTPSVDGAKDKFGQSRLKATMLTSSLILLLCLILIRILPSLPPDTVLCTLGLSHLDLGSPIPSCSPCFNTTVVSFRGTPCVMVTSMDEFSNFFIPLFILGSWCLFEEVAFLCKRCQGWPLSYRMLLPIKEGADEENPNQAQLPMLDVQISESS